MVGPLRGERGVTPPTTKQKTTFFSINGENSPGSCIMKILFCEARLPQARARLDQDVPGHRQLQPALVNRLLDQATRHD